MRKIILALVLLYSGSAWAQVGQIASWPPKAIVIGGGVGSCSTAANTEVQTWGTTVDGQGGAVSPTQCGNVDTLVTSLKTAVGSPLSSNISRLWLATSADTTAGDIQAQFKVDLIHDSLLDFTHANVGARLVHTTGYTPNGTSEYAITPFTASTSDTSVYATNNASMGVYILSTAVDVGDRVYIGAYDGTAADQMVQYTTISTNWGVTFLHDLIGESLSSVFVTPFGFALANRSTASNVTVSGYQSSTASRAGNAGDTVISLTTVPMYIGARNNQSSPDDFESASIGAVMLGRAYSDAEADAIAAALNTYMTSVGAAHW